jgi:hypothetical protein
MIRAFWRQNIKSTSLEVLRSFCFGFNKTLTNLTSLHQHHLQYKEKFTTTITNLINIDLGQMLCSVLRP